MSDSTPVHIKRLQRAVLAGGGGWVGIQEGMAGTPDLVLFNSPTTGSTLALSLPAGDSFSDSNFSAEVHKRIEESDKEFADRPVSVKTSVLKDLSNRLVQLSDEIDKLYLRREKCPSKSKSSRS